MRKVELRHFVARYTSRVLDVHRDSDLVSGFHICVIDAWLFGGERCVAQAEAEGIERRAIEVAIRAFGHGVVIERRKLIDGFVECYRQAARWTEISRKRFGDRRSALSARIPRFKNCWNIGVAVGPIDGERAAIRKNEDRGFADGGNSFKELFLRNGQIDACAIAARKTIGA